MVVVLNATYGGVLPTPIENESNEAQRACVTGLCRAVQRFLATQQKLPRLPDLQQRLKESRFDYAGEPVCLMEELHADKVIPCWPRVGEAAVQKAEDFIPEAMKELLFQPKLLLLPPDQWPERPPPCKVRATSEEWTKICKAGVERRMMVGLRKSDVFHDHQGRPVFNGAMAVTKYKKISGEWVKLQRFISNLVPSNSYQRHLPGDDVHLPYLGQMAMFSLDEDQELLVDSEDLTSCYNLFSLPKEWASYMAFGKPVDSSIFGYPPGEEMFPAISVIPMGWLSAASLTQAIVRHLVFNLSKVPATTELRKTADFPAGARVSVIYLDSFDELRKVSKGCRAVLKGEMSEHHQAFKATCERLGLPLNDGKRVVAATEGALQGGEVDGVEGFFRLPANKQAQLVGLSLALLVADTVTEFELRHWAGKAIFGMSFRRPLMALLDAVFKDVIKAQAGPIRTSPATRDEIVSVMALVPLMAMNFRTALDDEVTVTDASPTGGGGAIAREFKSEPQRTEHDGRLCHCCGREFTDEGRYPCPADCGVALCCLGCIWQHRDEDCRRKAYPCPRFGERFAGSANLSRAVAQVGGIEVQKPFDLEWGDDFFSPEGKAQLDALENDPLLKAEHWAPDCKLFSRARGRPITLRSGRRIKGPQPVRDEWHVMGYPWLSGDMKARLRKSNSMALRSIKRGFTCNERQLVHSVEHPWNSWMWEMQPAKQLEEENHCFGGAREKWTGLLVNSQDVALAVHHPTCQGHDNLKTYEVEERPDGSLYYPTEEEAAYPPLWCRAYAQGLHADFERNEFFERTYREGRLAWLHDELGQSTDRLQEEELRHRACVTLFELEEEMKRGTERDHLARMARKASIRGSDLRLHVTVNDLPQELPYPAYRWFWEEKLSYAWKSTEHINYLEIRAFIAMLKRRARQVGLRSTRYLHIVDSAVTRGAVAKGRSSSPQVNKLLRKICALCVASDTYPLVAWTISRWNFADLASRRKPPARSSCLIVLRVDDPVVYGLLRQLLYARDSSTTYKRMNKEAQKKLLVRVRTPLCMRTVLKERAVQEVKAARDKPAELVHECLDRWEIENLAEVCRSLKFFDEEAAGQVSTYLRSYGRRQYLESYNRKAYVRPPTA
eukprot:s2795_g6.t1